MPATTYGRSQVSNQAIRRLIPLAALFCVALSRSAMGQAMLLNAATSTSLTVDVFADTADGRVSLNPDAAQPIQDQYTGTDWGFFDDGTLVIGKNAQPVQQAVYLTTQDRTFFVFHFTDKTHIVNGTVIRSSTDPKQGAAELFLTTLAADGSSTTAYVQFLLTFVQ
jgi:hypothetical protein